MAGSVSVEQPASVWPPVPSTSATASTVPDPNSHLGFSLPQHPYAEDPNPLEAFGYERLELPWWGCTAESPSLLTGSVGASTAAGSSTSCRRSPFLYAPPAAQQSISGVMSGMAPHSSLFDQSEAECMDHWFSALKGDSLMGTVAEWHEKGTQQHFQHSRRHKSNGGANNTLSKSQPSPRKEASVDTPNGLHEKQQQPEVNGPSSGRAAPAKKRRKSTPQAQQIGERGQERELPPATAKMQPDLSPSPPQEAATGGSAADLQYQSQLKQRSKLPLTSQQKRQNHIESEKRRRETIKVAFGALVDVLREANALDGEDDQTKAKPRGRGRKGEGTGGATKNVVLAKAVEHVKWLKEGNEALRREVAQLERNQA